MGPELRGLITGSTDPPCVGDDRQSSLILEAVSFLLAGGSFLSRTHQGALSLTRVMKDGVGQPPSSPCTSHFR